MLQSLVGAAFSTLGSGGLSRLKQLDSGAVTASGESLEDLFHKYDADESGTVDKAELTAMMHELGHDVSGEELDALIRKVDKDGSGAVTPDEILLFFRNITASSYIPVYAELQHDIRRTRHLAWMLADSGEITALTDHFFAEFGSKKVDFEKFQSDFLNLEHVSKN